MSMKVKMNWKKRPAELIQKYQEKAGAGLERFAIELQNQLVINLSVGGTKDLHSQPWEVPYTQTGMLKRSIGYEKESLLRILLGTGIGGKTSPGYAMYLEYGTVKMLPRPFFRPALWQSRDLFRETMKEALA